MQYFIIIYYIYALTILRKYETLCNEKKINEIIFKIERVIIFLYRDTERLVVSWKIFQKINYYEDMSFQQN